MTAVEAMTPTKTGGREATTRRIPPKLALSVGKPDIEPPTGWRWVALTDVARLESGHTPSRKHPEWWGGPIPWLSIQDARDHHGRTITETVETTNNLGIANSSARVLPAGTVCLSRTASVGYVVVMGRPMATSQDFVNWVCSDVIEPDFLKYLFIAEGDDLLRFASGAVHQTIYFPEAKAFYVCLPSVREQRRIVSILDDALEGVAAMKANVNDNLNNARAVFDSALNSLLKHSASKSAARLSDYCEQITVGHVGPMVDQYREHGIPFLRSQNVKPFEISRTNITYIDSDFHRSLRKSSLRPGDLAIVRTGFPGTAAVIPSDLSDANCSDLVIIRPKSGVSPDFLAAFFNSSLGKHLVGVSLVGAAQKHFNVTAAKNVRLFIPPPAQQAEIVKKLSALRASTRQLESIYRQKVAALDALKKSLLHEAFSGNL